MKINEEDSQKLCEMIEHETDPSRLCRLIEQLIRALDARKQEPHQSTTQTPAQPNSFLKPTSSQAKTKQVGFAGLSRRQIKTDDCLLTTIY
jgi:hypothetical protein